MLLSLYYAVVRALFAVQKTTILTRVLLLYAVIEVSIAM